MNFTIYDKATGEIKRTGQCPDDDAPLQAKDGEALVEGSFHWHEFRWNGLKMERKPARPSAKHKWDVDKLDWSVDADALWAEIKAQRAKLLADSDWRMLPDAPGTPNHRGEWMAYRQALRDLTNQPDPTKIVWPPTPVPNNPR